MDATPGAGAANYPQLFRQMIVRSTEAALAAVDPQAAVLEEDERERSLYALSLALDLPEAWPAAKELLIIIAPWMRWQGYRDEWMAYLDKGVTVAADQADWPILARLHHQLGWLYQQLNRYDQAQEHSERAYALSVQNDDSVTRIAALDQLAVIASLRLDFTAARLWVDKVFQLTNADDPRRGFCCSVLGFIALQHGKWEDAISWYSESLRFHMIAGEHRFSAQSEQALAYVYTTTRRCSQALYHYEHVLETLASYPSLLDAAMTQMEIGLVYTYMHEYDQALAMYKRCEQVLIDTGSKLSLSHLYNNCGLACTGNGRFEQAEAYFASSIRLARELNMPNLVANAMDSLAEMFRVMGLLDKAIVVWEQAMLELQVLPEPPQYLYKLIARRIQETKGGLREPDGSLP